MIVTYAVKVTPENLTDIIKDVAKWDLNVETCIEDNMEVAAEYGEDCYAIVSVNYKSPSHATYTDMWGTDFHSCWTETGTTHKFWKVVNLNQ